jgi:hypothetical protein
MEIPPQPTPRESTEAMVRHIGCELAEIAQAIAHCQGDPIAEPKLTGTWMAHLLISSRELLHNLLIETATRPGVLLSHPGSEALDRAP